MGKKKKICNLIILDASGSMRDKADEVLYGLKDLFKEIRNSGDVKNHTIVCDFASAGDFRTLVKSKDSNALSDDLAESYVTRGMTALYDAIATAFGLVKKDFDGVFVNIMTDGLENNSIEASLKDVRKLISKKRKKGWVITFMGTTEEALKEAYSMGISTGNAFKYVDSQVGAHQAGQKRVISRARFEKRIQDHELKGSMPIADDLMEE